MRVVQITAVVAALIVTAWFVVGVRQAHDLSSAQSLVSRSAHVSSSTAAHVRSLLSSAAFLNPDTEVNVLRGRLALLQHDHARALDIFEGVVREEPLNLTAWVATAQAALNFDHRELVVAARNIGRLDKTVK
jgi:hypothetical protein